MVVHGILADDYTGALIWTHGQEQPAIQRGQDHVCEYNTVVDSDGIGTPDIDMGNE